MPCLTAPRLFQKPSPLHPDLYALRLQIALDLRNRVGPVMDHGGDQGGIGPAAGQNVGQMLRLPRPAGGDDGDPHARGDQGGKFDLIAVLGAVGVDGIEADLACPQPFRLLCPPAGRRSPYTSGRRG